jgi:hypothetical protein
MRLICRSLSTVQCPVRTLRVDHVAREIWLSEPLTCYTEDFIPAHGASLLDCVERASGMKPPQGHAVRYTPYDWTVAHQR